nr:EOG090X0AKT [Triops cancriformis]
MDMDSENVKEVENLRKEFSWLLSCEVHKVLEQLEQIIEAAGRRFPLPLGFVDEQPRQEKYVMATAAQTAQDQLKCVLTVTGDSITNADLTLKLHKHPNVVYHTSVSGDQPWKLQQIQDSCHQLQLCVNSLQQNPYKQNRPFHSVEEVISLMDYLWNTLAKARGHLLVPKKRTIDELMNSKNMRSLTPALPGDVAVSFYLQGPKLVFAVYHLTQAGAAVKFDTLQCEAHVSWLNDVLVLLTIALHKVQQIKDKVMVFDQYPELQNSS